MAKSGDGRRVAMVEREVLQSVARFVLQEMKEDLPGFVTISRIHMPSDLRSAKLSVSVLLPGGGDEAAARKDAVKTLNAWAWEIQQHLESDLKLRFTPKLTFIADDSTEHVLKVENILRDLKREEAPSAASKTAAVKNENGDEE